MVKKPSSSNKMQLPPVRQSRDPFSQEGLSLEEENKLFHLLCDSADDSILMLHPDGSIVYANRAISRCLKMPVDKIKGKSFEDFVCSKSKAEAQAVFAKMKKGPGQRCVEINVVDNKRGVKTVEVTAFPVVSQGKLVAVHVIARDITRRKQYERLVIEAEKEKALRFFTNGAAQELKHPLMGVHERLQKILKKYKTRDFEYIGFKEYQEIMQSLEYVKDEVKYCYDTTARMIELNARQAGVAGEVCQANLVVQNIVQPIKAQLASHGIKCSVRLGTGLPSIKIGEIDFTQIMHNLINNAVQSMPGGGTLKIRASCRGGTHVKIDVQDDGVGISKENLEHVYEPFFTTRARGKEKNSGLGLAIVYSLVKACCGDIEILSDLRKGTIVSLLIPVGEK